MYTCSSSSLNCFLRAYVRVSYVKITWPLILSWQLLYKTSNIIFLSVTIYEFNIQFRNFTFEKRTKYIPFLVPVKGGLIIDATGMFIMIIIIVSQSVFV